MGRIAAEARKRNWWWDDAVGDGTEEEELGHYAASLESLKKLDADGAGRYEDLVFYVQTAGDGHGHEHGLSATFLAELQNSR